MKDLNVFVDGEQKMLVLREGKALDLREPLVVDITGDINTVKSFIAKRYTAIPAADIKSTEMAAVPLANIQSIDKNKAIIVFDKSDLSISLDVDPVDFYGPKIKGKLQISDELEPFGINETGMFNREKLVKLLRFNKRFFTDAAVHDKVLSAFQNLSITGETELKAASDTRGNKSAAFGKKLNTDSVPTTFYLTMPIYKGLDARKFLVEICIDSSEASIGFWFESVELKELQDSIVDTIFEEQKKEFSDFVIVNK